MMNARPTPIAVAGKEVELTSPLLPNQRFGFKELFAPQVVTLTPLGNPKQISFASNLPQQLQLTPSFQNGNLALIVSGVMFNPEDPPQPLPVWSVQDSMINNSDGISIILVDNLGDLLVLNGNTGENPLVAEGHWRSNLFPGVGRWTSKIAGQGSLPTEFWWTFLLAPGKDNAHEDDILQTVILGFQATGSEDHPFEQYSSFPTGWQAFDLDLGNNGVSLTLVSPAGLNYCLTSGFFSGGLGRLVCQGTWQHPSLSGTANRQLSNLSLVAGDTGTWTGTSSGPIPPSSGS